MSEIDVITLGCRLNAFESEVMRDHARAAGLEKAIVVNTCAVTSEAVRKATQTIRKLRRDHPSAKIIVTGCAAQIEPERFAAMPDVDHVIGNDDKLKAETYQSLAVGAAGRMQVNDIMAVREAAPHMIDAMHAKARAFLQIQNGCDHRCTFCIIPFARGPSRSVAAGDVVNHVRRVVENGVPEVVLTGVDITSYGPDLPGDMTLGKLVRQILKHVPELKRLRLSSIDQVEADADLMRALAEEPRLMPHLHLSMQSGDDMILKRMKRRHLRADAVRFCNEARRLRPEVVFGADLIAGFPTETDAMFENSVSLADDCGLTFLHVFPFSARTGTPAAKVPQVNGNIIKQRAARLRHKGTVTLSSYLQRQTGVVHEVLMENGGIGRTPQFIEVTMTGGTPPRAGLLVRVEAMQHDCARLLGRVQAGEVAA
ncbi:MAG: tRNA (N(6)-L-threonylcarbamoyladenosine(37)-C(2))-methylthiotransferase MtaB [Hyphomicrobium sp.]